MPFVTDSDTARHDEMVKLVDKIHHAKAREDDAKVSFKKEYWRQQVAALDRQIDGLVYELYGLTEEEIALVEGGV